MVTDPFHGCREPSSSFARSYARIFSREPPDGRRGGPPGALSLPTIHGKPLAPSQLRAPKRNGQLQLTAPPRPPVRRFSVGGLALGRRASMSAPGGAPIVRRRAQGLREANRTPATQPNPPGPAQRRQRGAAGEQENTPGTLKKAGGGGAGQPKPQRADRGRQRRLELEPAQEVALKKACVAYHDPERRRAACASARRFATSSATTPSCHSRRPLFRAPRRSATAR